MEMRQALCECLDEMMAENENIVVIDADLAKPNGTFPLRKKYPAEFATKLQFPLPMQSKT